jgi:endoglucanase
MKKIITSTLGLMLLLASCGTDPSKTVSLEGIPAIKTQPEQQLKAASLGNAAKGDWVGKWTSVATGRALYNFANIGIQGGIQTGTNIKYAFAHDNNVMIRSGTFGNTLTTAYLVRVPNASKDHFEGWYANYNCEAGCKGTIAYFEMKRDIKSASIDSANWYGRFDPKPLDTLVGGNFLLKTKAGIAAPGGTQDGTNIDYRIGNGTIRRSGTYNGAGRTFGTTAEMLEVPGTGHYIGWYANSDSSKLGFFVAANRTPVAGGTQWSMLHEAANVVPSSSGTWATEANGFVKNTSVQYTINSDKDLFRSGAPAHLLYSSDGVENYKGWYTTSTGTLNYFDATRAAPNTQMRGVNLAGLEFGPNATNYANMPLTLTDLNNRNVNQYATPNADDIDRYVEQGVNTFRIPFRWERLQFAPSAGDGADGSRTVRSFPINESYFNEINALVTRANNKGARVILDMHNYGTYIRYPQNTPGQDFRGFNLIGQSSVSKEDFAFIWGELAKRYKNNNLVMFGLMNEPLYEYTSQLVPVYQAAISAIRAQGFANSILVNGNYYGGAWSWNNESFGIPNVNRYFANEADRYAPSNKIQVKGQPTNNPTLPNSGSNSTWMTKLTDSNVIFEAHQYFDQFFSGSANSGEAKACDSNSVNGQPAATSGDLLKNFTTFLGTQKRGFIGEFGSWTNGTNCDQRLTQALSYLNTNAAYVGWTYWASGLNAVTDKMTITPYNSQMNLIRPYLR